MKNAVFKFYLIFIPFNSNIDPSNNSSNYSIFKGFHRHHLLFHLHSIIMHAHFFFFSIFLLHCYINKNNYFFPYFFFSFFRFFCYFSLYSRQNSFEQLRKQNGKYVYAFHMFLSLSKNEKFHSRFPCALFIYLRSCYKCVRFFLSFLKEIMKTLLEFISHFISVLNTKMQEI